MEKIIKYYLEVLLLYGNKPQLAEYRLFFGISLQNIEDYERSKEMKIAA